ncbi:MAG: hypothetical protein Q7R71_02020 [bacterium]|nr:hypothetical protein [bacterium]
MIPDSGLLHLIIEYRYWILFPLACIEGPMLAFIAGTLVALGYFDPFLVFGILVLGDVVPDVCYYFIGRYGKRKALIDRFGPRIGITPERFEIARTLWFTHTFKTMLITKFAYGLSTPLLVTAGLVHLPFNRFWRSSLPLSVLQYIILLALGYFFGTSFALVESSLARVQLIVAGVAVLFAVYYFVTSSVRTKFLAGQREE